MVSSFDQAAMVELGAACMCRRCVNEREIPNVSWTMRTTTCRMIVCVTCGNKRCPHATDHRLDCTGSNKPGQPGSVFA